MVFVPLAFDQWPEWRRSSLLAHEAIHHRQQKKLGLGYFCLYYALNPAFRWRIEQRGYLREAVYLIRRGYAPDPKRYAQAVSGALYGGMIDYATALNWFEARFTRFLHCRD